MQDISVLQKTTEKPGISFIIAYYNLPPTLLCKCIDSLLALSIRNTEREIIIVDDGSKKSPIDELLKYEQDIRYIRQPHQGLSEARNTGLRMASFGYIQFVDADDQILRAPYEHCIDLLRLSKPEMVVFNLTRTPSMTVDFTDSDIQSGSSYMRYHNIHGSACGYVFSRSILGDLRFTPGIYHEDEEFTPQLLLRAEKVCITNAKAYLYSERPGSIVIDTQIRTILKRLEDTRGIIKRLNIMADRLPTNDRLSLQRRVAQLTMDYLYNIIRQTKSRDYLEKKIQLLRRDGLFPLPDANYTVKYSWFRRLIDSQTGITILMRLIPLLHKEQ